MNPFIIQARLKTPLIRNGYMTLDAMLMAELQRADVSHIIKCVDGLYYASAVVLADGLQTAFAWSPLQPS